MLSEGDVRGLCISLRCVSDMFFCLTIGLFCLFLKLFLGVFPRSVCVFFIAVQSGEAVDGGIFYH